MIPRAVSGSSSFPHPSDRKLRTEVLATRRAMGSTTRTLSVEWLYKTTDVSEAERIRGEEGWGKSGVIIYLGDSVY